jgi:ArsR family transcriptional regulator
MEAVKLDPASFFAALADPTRLQLLRILARQPAGCALCVNALAAHLGISQPAVSQHLQVLRGVGLVYPVRRGMRVHYYLDRQRLLSWQKLVHELFAGAGDEWAEACEGTNRAMPCGESKQGES